MRIKHTIALTILLATSTPALYADDGWYLTRKPVPIANQNLEDRKSDIRDLITDCKERGISLSCHRAGKWFLDKGKAAGLEYIKQSCRLGRGYSCRVVGNEYLRGSLVAKSNNTAIEWFKQGCLREDQESCTLQNATQPDPVKKKEYQRLLEWLDNPQ